MYPQPELNSFLQGCNPHVYKAILNRCVDKAVYSRKCNSKSQLSTARLASTQPLCYAPRVDVSRSKCAFGTYALPKLKKELHSEDPLIVRQAVTTLGDLLIYPEKLIEALKLDIPDSLTYLLSSNDPYLRERTAIIYLIMANQNAGRKAIRENFTTLLNLSKNLDDKMAAVRLITAQVIEMLARESITARLLVVCGFTKSISRKMYNEKTNVLLVYLDALKWLLMSDSKAKSNENETFDILMSLLNRDNESVLVKVLACLTILCEDLEGKRKANQVDLLNKLKTFFTDKRETVKIEAIRLASFVTITTEGKLRAVELKMANTLLYLATKKSYICNCELLLVTIKTLTNIAEVPEARKTLFEEYLELLSAIDVGEYEILQRHKQTLINVICWRP